MGLFMMSPYLQDKFLPEIQKLNRLVGPVVGTRLADLLGLPERTVRYWLHQLEKAGYVTRPHGKRKGWVVCHH